MSNVIPLRPPLRRRPAGDASPEAGSGSSWGFLAMLFVGLAALEGVKYWAGTHTQSVYLPRRNPWPPGVVYGMDMLARIARQPDRRVMFYVGESLPMERDIARLKRDGLIELYNDSVTQPLSGPRVRLTSEGVKRLGDHVAKTQAWMKR